MCRMLSQGGCPHGHLSFVRSPRLVPSLQHPCAQLRLLSWLIFHPSWLQLKKMSVIQLQFLLLPYSVREPLSATEMQVKPVTLNSAKCEDWYK